MVNRSYVNSYGSSIIDAKQVIGVFYQVILFLKHIILLWMLYQKICKYLNFLM